VPRRLDTSDVIDTIYAAGVEPARWPQALDLLRRLCKADSAAISVQHVTLGTGARTDIGYPNASRPRYFDGFAAVNPLFKRLLRRPIGVSYPSQALIDDDTLKNSPYFNDYCRPNGIYYMAGMIVHAANDEAAWITVNRDRTGSAFEPVVLRTLSGLARHVRRAFQTSRVLGTAQATQTAWEATLDALTHGLMLLDHQGRVVFANQAARQLAAKGDGFTLRGECPSAPLDALTRLITQATAGNRVGGHLALPRRSARQPLSVLVVPLPSDTAAWPGIGAPAALMVLTDPTHAPTPEVSQLMAIFGLTEREAALTASLTAGETLAGAAAHLDIGHETARTHLAHALSKTGSSRQVDLVRLALAIAPPITQLGLDRNGRQGKLKE